MDGDASQSCPAVSSSMVRIDARPAAVLIVSAAPPDVAGETGAVVVAAALLVVLLALWLSATRRHARRRRDTQREWDTAQHRPELWTSAARCPECERSGGLLEVDDDGDVWFVCLSCQHRYRRSSLG